MSSSFESKDEPTQDLAPEQPITDNSATPKNDDPDSRIKRKDYKTIFFIRHAESTHNMKFRQCTTWVSGQCLNLQHKDAKLSLTGEKQVQTLKEQLEREQLFKQIQVVLTSPLSRALQTCRAFDGSNVPVEVCDLLTEVVHNTCDIGRDPSELAKEFPTYDFKKLKKIWWYNKSGNDAKGVVAKEPESSLIDRTNKFRLLLRDRPEQSIAVVGHSIFFSAFTNKRARMKNGEIVKMFMDTDGELIDTSARTWSCYSRGKSISSNNGEQ